MTKSLTTSRLAYNNLCAKPGRTVSLVLVVLIMAFALFGGAVLSRSLDHGIHSLEARLGADIAVVPLGSERDYENVILAGNPVSFYFDRRIESHVASAPGVEQITTQLHLATLADAVCCTTTTQVIGIDYATDFVVMPWIAHFLQRQIDDGTVVVGSDVVVGRDNTITFFDVSLTVAARLERTATGMDSTVFVNMNTAHTLTQQAAEAGLDLGGPDIEHAASAILVRVHPDYDVDAVAASLRSALPDVGLVVSSAVFSNISANLNFFTGILHTITIVLAILSVLILAVLFSVIASGRKKEFAILRVLGATRKKLAGIVLTEALFVSLLGTVLGSLLAALLVFPFGRHIGMQMGMPLLLPDIWEALSLLAVASAASLAIGPLSAAYSAFRISQAETYATLREGE